jgi:mannose-1-phosphate guanylyltransferase
MSEYSGIILAGGDGTRLASLTRRLAGDGRPKQFCRLIGDDTLLEQTRRRARVLVGPERLLTVVTATTSASTGLRSRTLHLDRSSRSQTIAGRRRRSCTLCRVSLGSRRRIRW